MMRFLLHCNGKGAFVEMQPGDSSDYYGQVQDAFIDLARPRAAGIDRWCDMIRLYPDHITDAGVMYQWELSGPDGAWYRLLKLPDVTDEQVTRSKAWLRHRFDVVSLDVLRVNELVVFAMPPRASNPQPSTKGPTD
jgi:hypothetical protein